MNGRILPNYMALKRKGRWRSLLGMKGELWYYTDQETKTADRPHQLTVRLALLSPLLAIVAVAISMGGLYYTQKGIKVGQRAYLSTGVSSSKNAGDVTTTVEVKNVGNTPADVRAFVLTKPWGLDSIWQFDRNDKAAIAWFSRTLPPKDSDWLGRAMWKPDGDTTGFVLATGVIDYTDVFDGSDTVYFCYALLSGGKTTDCPPALNKVAIDFVEASIRSFRYKRDLADNFAP